MGEKPARESLERHDTWKLLSINLAGVTFCVFFSIAFNAFFFWKSPGEAFARAMVSAVALPLMLGIPLFCYLSVQLRNLWALNGRLVELAARDSLTRLLNRGAFIDQVGRKLDGMAAASAPRGALLVIDADFFKLVNDRWGHAVGDEALRRIAETLGRHARNGDLVGRLGGEEFAVFLYGSSRAAAQRAAEKLRQSVEAIELFAGEHRVPLTISVGGVHFREVLGFNVFYQLADRKLYEAKANGRNRVEFEHLGADAAFGAAA